MTEARNGAGSERVAFFMRSFVPGLPVIALLAAGASALAGQGAAVQPAAKASAVASTKANASLDGPIAAKLELRVQRCRSGAPIPILWTLDSKSPLLVEGALEYELYDGTELLARLQIPDVALSNGKNVFNAVLPAVSLGTSTTPLTIRARFRTAKDVIELDEQTLRVPSKLRRWFAVGAVRGGTAAVMPEEKDMLDRLRVESLVRIPDELQRSGTVVTDLVAANLPADPLSLCWFDVLVLFPSALAELRDEQFAALLKWTQAGGSLCVVAAGGLASRHAVFLNNLFDEDRARGSFVVDPRGFLSPGESEVGAILSARRGLGRVVALREPLLKGLNPEKDEWRQAVGFLWKCHNNPDWIAPGERGFRINAGTRQSANNSRVRKRGAPRTAPSSAPPTSVAWSPIRRFPENPLASTLAAPPLATTGDVVRLLMPRDVQMVPLLVIAAVLGAYVLAIGPVDYFLLGLLRLRRYTWIAFPIVTLLFALFTLRLSHWYLGSNDSRRGIEIYDVVKGGVVARRSRIELLFLSDQREVENPVRNGLFANLQIGPHLQAGSVLFTASGGRMYVEPAVTSSVPPPNFLNRYPSRYSVVQSVPQWTPVLNRFFWIDPRPWNAPTASIDDKPEQPDAPAEAGNDDSTNGNRSSRDQADADKSNGSELDWDELGEWIAHLPQSQSVQKLRESIARAFGDRACAVICRQGETRPILKKFKDLQFWREPERDPYYWHPEGVDLSDAFLREFSVREPRQLFSLVSQVSPNGGPDLEDLALLDPSNPQEALLVIAVEKGPDLLIYRRLYAGVR